MNTLIRNLSLFAVSVVGALVLSSIFASIYQSLTGEPLGSFLDFSFIIGSLLAFPFLAALAFTLFGGRNRFYFVAVFTFPFLLLLVSRDLVFVSYIIAEVLIAVLLGYLARPMFVKFRK